MKVLRSAFTQICLATVLVTVGCYESDDDTPSPPEEPANMNPGEGGGDDGDDDGDEPDATVEPEPDATEEPEPDATVEPDLVDYATEIQPILDQMCTHCHGGPMPKKNLDLTAFAGTRSKVVPCDCAGSLLIKKIGPNPPAGKRMPADGPPYLTDAQQELICQWVNEGALESPAQGACP